MCVCVCVRACVCVCTCVYIGVRGCMCMQIHTYTHTHTRTHTHTHKATRCYGGRGKKKVFYVDKDKIMLPRDAVEEEEEIVVLRGQGQNNVST